MFFYIYKIINRNPELRSMSSRHCSCESVPKSVPRLLLALLGNLIPISVVVLPLRLQDVPSADAQVVQEEAVDDHLRHKLHLHLKGL